MFGRSSAQTGPRSLIRHGQCQAVLVSPRITESQNHRMAGFGRDLWGSSSPTPLPKQGHLQQVAQDLIQVGSEYLQRRTFHNASGQPVPGLRHPRSKAVLPRVQTEHPMLQQLLPFCWSSNTPATTLPALSCQRAALLQVINYPDDEYAAWSCNGVCSRFPRKAERFLSTKLW